MKQSSFLLVSIIIVSVVCNSPLYSQDPPLDSPRFNPRFLKEGRERASLLDFRLQSKDKISKVPTNWADWIDSAWGPGLATSTKLNIFDTFWDIADQQYGGFPNLDVNWDSLRDHYRPLVQAGVSRGRFLGIMTRMFLALQEQHTWARDRGVDSSFFFDLDGGIYWWPYERVPLTMLGGWGITTSGMGLAPMPDSSLFVYRAQAGNPLGIQAGDIILGYDGRKWKEILSAFDSEEVPLSKYFSVIGSDPDAYSYSRLNAASLNWYMFDTIDIVRYATAETVHLSTQPLADAPMFWDSLMCMDQIDVPGVSVPDAFNDNWCSSGIVEGTTIGYIYLWSMQSQTTGTEFAQAVRELMNTTTGLIIDIRANWGGTPKYFNEGFSYLFNHNPDLNFNIANRSSIWDHFSFTHEPTTSHYAFGDLIPTPDIYNHPIAVLTGPGALSAGDYAALRMKFHPMARFFGKRTNTAYVNGYYLQGTLVQNPWTYRVPKGSGYSDIAGDGFLIHKGFNVDEEVWLDRDNAANGVDNVVKRALEWINNVAYAHDISTDNRYYAPGTGSAQISIDIENPNGHTISAKAYLQTDDNVIIDSVDLNTTPMRGQGLWGGTWNIPADENNYTLSVTVTDHTEGTTFPTPPLRNSWKFTSAGPVVLDSLSIVRKNSTQYEVRPYLRNDGITDTLRSLSVALEAPDPWVKSLDFSSTWLSQMIPGGVVTPSTPFTITVDTMLFPGYFDFTFVVSSQGWPYWRNPAHPVLASVALTSSPDGGWIWIDRTDTVVWNSLNVQDVKVELSTDNGLTWPIVIAESLPAIDGILVWTVPDAPAKECRLKISDAMHPAINSLSGTFSIAQSRMVMRNRWNLVSVPHHLNDNFLDVVYPTHTSEAFCFTDHYVAEDTLEQGCGYWLKFGSAETVHVFGEPAVAETIEVNEGWNIIGSLTIPMPVSSITSDPPGMTTSSVYGYEGMYGKAETILPGKGYWIKASMNGKLVLDAVGGSTRGYIKCILLDVPPPPPDGEISEVNPIPKTHALHQNYPNPFNPVTVIRYALPVDGYVIVRVFDVLGREVATLVDGVEEAGYKSVTWNAGDVPSGIYFCRMTSGEYVGIRKLILMK